MATPFSIFELKYFLAAIRHRDRRCGLIDRDSALISTN